MRIWRDTSNVHNDNIAEYTIHMHDTHFFFFFFFFFYAAFDDYYYFHFAIISFAAANISIIFCHCFLSPLLSPCYFRFLAILRLCCRFRHFRHYFAMFIDYFLFLMLFAVCFDYMSFHFFDYSISSRC